MLRFVNDIRCPDHFGSGTRTTPEFDSFVKRTRNDFRKHLADVAEEIHIDKGHFYFYGYLTRKSDGQAIYFSISDVRYFPGDKMLIRAAKDYHDYTGGPNNYVPIDRDFEANLKRAIRNL
jgi:hypothetical protein